MRVLRLTNLWRPTVVLLVSPTTPMQDSDSSWLLQNYPASQKISRASSILQEAKQLSNTTFPQAKSNESMGPSPESKKPLRAMGIHLLLRAVPSTACGVKEDQWWCQSLGFCEKRKEPDVHVWQQEAHIKVRDKTVDPKETKDLYRRLMVLARSNRDINQKLALGTYEFTLITVCPRWLSVAMQWQVQTYPRTREYGRYRHRPCRPARTAGWKHTLQCVLSLPKDCCGWWDGPSQKLSKKAAAVVTVKDLSVCFNDRLMNLTRYFDEVIVVFDSLKNRTRQKRRKGKEGPRAVSSPRWDQHSAHQIESIPLYVQRQIWHNIWLRQPWTTTKIPPSWLLPQRQATQEVTEMWALFQTTTTKKQIR